MSRPVAACLPEMPAGPGPVPRVRVVVLNFDGGQLTIDCLQSLLATEYPDGFLEIVLVDNGSIDDVVERVRRDFPVVRVLEPLANLGFAGGCNLGIRAEGAFDYVALVNNDATVSPGWLKPLVGVLESDSSVGAVSPKMLFADRYAGIELVVPDAGIVFPPDTRILGVRVSGVRLDGVRVDDRLAFDEGFYGPEFVDTTKGEEIARWCRGRGAIRVKVDVGRPGTISLRLSCPKPRTVRVITDEGEQTRRVGPQAVWVDMRLGACFNVINNAGSNLYARGHGGDRGFLEHDRGQYDEPADTFGWCGGAVLLRQQYLEAVGLFDEALFLYYEDFDLSWRGQLRGWRYRYEPSSVVRHRHAATSVEGSPVFRFHTERNRLLVVVKNAPAGMAVWELAAETRRLVSAHVQHVLLRVLRLRFPQRQEPQFRWRLWRSLIRHLPAAVVHRWREPVTSSRAALMRWETHK